MKIQLWYIANSTQTINTSIVAKRNYLRTVSLYEGKLLIGMHNDTQLYVYSTNGIFVASIQVPHELLCAKWTHHGNILYIANGGLACLISQFGQVLKQHKTIGLTSINVMGGLLYLTDGTNGFYALTDGGRTLKLKNKFFQNVGLWKIIKVVTNSQSFWTIEDDDKLHFYTVNQNQDKLKEHVIHSLPPTLSELKYSHCCDIAFDGYANIFLTDYYNDKVHALSVNGRYLSQLLNGTFFPCSLAVDEEHKRVYVANRGSKITSFTYT